MEKSTMPEQGFLIVRNYRNAKELANSLNIDMSKWAYILNQDQLMGLRIPNDRKFYFINWDIPVDLIKPHLKRGE